mgnify:CR=1 FL=1
MTPEIHPLEPFLPAGAKVLMLGSFPPARHRWGMEFYYPNFQNDMWRIMGLVFYGSRDKFLAPDGKRFDRDAIVGFCTEKGIALSDTAAEAVRLKDNASDAFLQITRNRDIGELLDKIPECRAVITTGQKATETFCSEIPCAEPPVGGYSEFEYRGRRMTLWRMPSSSRAYPKHLAEKAAIYGDMFREAGII